MSAEAADQETPVLRGALELAEMSQVSELEGALKLSERELATMRGRVAALEVAAADAVNAAERTASKISERRSAHEAAKISDVEKALTESKIENTLLNVRVMEMERALQVRIVCLSI